MPTLGEEEIIEWLDFKDLMTMKMQMVMEEKIHHLLTSTVQKSNQKGARNGQVLVQLLLMQMEVVMKMIQK
jgi:hypothetical protein